ncbi:MAG: PIG-L family deacetylase [Clostridiaceae bacterium]
MIAASSLLAAAVLFFCVVWPAAAKNAFYDVPDVDRNTVFANRRVMLIVPHEDDEINLLSGVMELYAAAGSEVYVVFVTNGDYATSAETRIDEALRATAIAGVNDDHVLFLGYGDEVLPDLYSGPENKLYRSTAGYTHTYGSAAHLPYHASDYTRNHLIRDIIDVLNEYLPDVIYCVDYDGNPDHRATSLAFEEALGQVLRQRSDYTPLVLKGFAYSTAWYAPNDFYADNLLSMTDASKSSSMRWNNIYRWDDRIRLPVTAGDLSHLEYQTITQRALSAHDSQNAVWHTECIINGDKVFWWRQTSSVLYRADIRVSSGEASTLNDFKLIDTKDVQSYDLPYQNAWSPDAEDQAPTITITLEQPTVLKELWLYDQPSLTDNVLNAVILLDGKQALETSPLAQNGSATVVSLDSATPVSSIEIRITDWQGERWGITELEAYTQTPESGLAFAKLTDEKGNFLYDAWTKPDGTILLKLYRFPASQKDSLQDCTVSVDNPRCTANKGQDGLLVTCPVNEECLVRVSDGTDGRYSDTIRVSNPAPGERAWIHALQWMEAHKLDRVNQRAYYRQFKWWCVGLDFKEWVDKISSSIARK